jgi:hypothetical protein
MNGGSYMMTGGPGPLFMVIHNGYTNISESGVGNSINYTYSGINATNVWWHWALVRSGNRVSTFINGIRRGTGIISFYSDSYATEIENFPTGLAYFDDLVYSSVARYDPTQTTITIPTEPAEVRYVV